MLVEGKEMTPRYSRQKPVGHPLKELILGRSPIGNPASVAAFLSCFFPSVTKVQGLWIPIETLETEDGEEPFSEEDMRGVIIDSEHEDAWRHVVNVLLPEFVRIREDERAWPIRNRGRLSLPPSGSQ